MLRPGQSNALDEQATMLAGRTIEAVQELTIGDIKRLGQSAPKEQTVFLQSMNLMSEEAPQALADLLKAVSSEDVGRMSLSEVKDGLVGHPQESILNQELALVTREAGQLLTMHLYSLSTGGEELGLSVDLRALRKAFDQFVSKTRRTLPIALDTNERAGGTAWMLLSTAVSSVVGATLQELKMPPPT